MKTADIIKALYEIQMSHRDDGDGGYSLVASIRQWILTQSSAKKTDIYMALISLVQNVDPLWGVALEVLSQERSQHAAEWLIKIVPRNKNSQEWNDNVVLTLIRMRYQEGADFFTRYISEALASQVGDKRTLAVMMLASFCHISKDRCVDLAALYYGMHLTSPESASGHSWTTPAFTAHFAEIDDQLFGDVIRRTRNVNVEAAVWLKTLFNEHLDKPFVLRKLGAARVAHIHDVILNA